MNPGAQSGLERLAERLGIESPREKKQRLTQTLLKRYGVDEGARRRKLKVIDEELRVLGRRARTEGLLSMADSERVTALATQRLELTEGEGAA